jgi:hypothetical protein
MRRIIRLPSDPLSRASFADPLDIIDTDSFCSGSSPSSGNLPPVGEETLTYRNDPDEEEGTDGIDDKTKEGESLRIGRPEKTRRRILSDDDDEDISPEGGRKRMKVDSSTIDQPSNLQNVALSPTSAAIFMDSPTQAASPSAGSSPFSSSPFISLVPPGLTGIETDIVERPDSLQQEGSTLEAMRSSGLPTPPATSAPIAAPEVTLPTEQPPGEMGDHDTDLIENSTNTPGLVENEGVEDEDMDPDQSDGHGKAQSIPPQSPAKLESNAKPDNPVSEDISEGVFPTKMITAEEGEDEIDLDDEPQEMDVDPPEATPAPADTETTRDDSAPSSVPKPIAKSQKNKPGAATGAEKKIKAKSAIQTKVGARQPGKGKGKTKVSRVISAVGAVLTMIKVNDLKSESSKPRSVSVSVSLLPGIYSQVPDSVTRNLRMPLLLLSRPKFQLIERRASIPRTPRSTVFARSHTMRKMRMSSWLVAMRESGRALLRLAETGWQVRQLVSSRMCRDLEGAARVTGCLYLRVLRA